MGKLGKLAVFALANFGPALAFYAANHFYGLKAAIIVSLAWTAGEIIAYRLKGKSTSTFFRFSAGITLLFGLVDLYLQRSVLVKYEAAVSSILVGLYFASTLLGEKPLIQEFAEAQGRVDGPVSDDGAYFFRFLTAVWVVYFFVKAAFYGWVAFRYSLEEGLIVRGTIGSVSFYGLLALSILGAGKIKLILAKLRLLPSSR